MKTNVKPIPDGYHSLTPYLSVHNAAEAIDFYTRALGARELHRLPMPGGKIGHAEIILGNSIFMMADEFPEFGNVSPQSLKGSPVGFALYVEDVDAAFDRAVKAGATVKEPVSLKFWGDRAGSVVDPYGYKWTLLTHVEDVSPEEMRKRMEKACAEMPSEKAAA